MSNSTGSADPAGEAIGRHIRAFFKGHTITEKRWDLALERADLSNLRVLEIGLGPRSGHWTYVTVGASSAASPFEWLVVGDRPRTEYVALLSLVAFYGLEHTLGLGHLVPIGRPLVEGSECEHVYFSLPYTYGPKLEIVPVDGAERRILWAFPITTPERDVIRDEGVDALEDRFEAVKVEYWSPFRGSVA